MTDRAANGPALPRRHVLGLLAPLLSVPLLSVPLLAGCDDSPPARTDFPPLTYDYLSKLKLLVANIDIDDAFAKTNTASTEHVENLAPVPPDAALARMARDRLIPAATSGHAVFVIEDAALTRAPGGFAGSMRVRLDVSTSDGTKAGFAEARANRTYNSTDPSDAGTRAALYELVKLMMSDMNVELEFQVKRRLRDYLQTDDGIAPPPAPVQTQDLNTGTPPPAIEPAPPPPPTPAPMQ